MKQKEVISLYFIVYIDNCQSFLTRGAVIDEAFDWRTR